MWYTLTRAIRRRLPRLVVIKKGGAFGWRGFWDGRDTITIAPGQPYEEEQLVLMHELLHAADDLSAHGHARLSKVAIARIAPVLLSLLAGLGYWPHLTPEAVKEARLRVRKDKRWPLEGEN